MNKYISYVGAIALVTGFATVAQARGPQPSADVYAFCGNPAVNPGQYDSAGNLIPGSPNTFTTNVGITIYNASDDSKVNEDIAGTVKVECIEVVPTQGKGRTSQGTYTTLGPIAVEIDGFGGFTHVDGFNCPGPVDPNATEWKARAIFQADGRTKTFEDVCEE